MAALMPASAAPALADMHSEPAADRPRLGQLVLILKLDALVHDLPATLTPRRKRRVELLIHLPRRLAMTMPAVLLARPATRPTRPPLRLPARERRRLTLPRPPRLLQLALKLPDPRPQPLVLGREPNGHRPQLLVLRHQRRAPRHEPRKLIHRLNRQHLNL